MAIPSIIRSKFRTDVLRLVKGNPDNTGTTVIDGLINQAVRDVLSEVDPRSTKRRMQLTVSGANDNRYDESDGFYDLPELIAVGGTQDNRYEYHCPVDLKGDRIADVRHRTNYTPEIRLTTEDEFHRRKTVEQNLAAISSNSWERKLLLANGPQISSKQIHSCNTYNGNGTFISFGDGSSIATETSSFVEGSGAVSFSGGVMLNDAGIQNSTMTAVDLTSYENHDIFVWVYIPSITNLTSITLRWGSSSSDYYSATVQQTHDALSFYVGWNLLRFDWSQATTVGSPDNANISYVAFYRTVNAVVFINGWIIDNIVARINPETDVVYYTKYGWQTSAGVYKEEADDDGDFLNADTEEYQMFVERAREYVSGKMGNDNDEKKFFDRAQNRIALYKSSNPSEAMPIQNSYYFFDQTPEAHDRTL